MIEAKSNRIVNWKNGKEAFVLESIHQEEVNIAIYERDIAQLKNEIDALLGQGIVFKASGTFDSIVNEMLSVLDPAKFGLLIEDMKRMLIHFKNIMQIEQFRFLLAKVDSNMCKKLHTDINDVRLLCTYSGPGTVWLSDDNVDRKALSDFNENASIAIDENKVQQAKTGAVVLLKGAIYPNESTRAIVHRSPTIEESGEQRLLLRIDTNETLNLWN